MSNKNQRIILSAVFCVAGRGGKNLKRKISAVVSLVLCVCVLLGSSAAAQENYIVDSSAQINYTENGNISQNYSESLPNVSKSSSKSTVRTPFIITFVRSTPNSENL